MTIEKELNVNVVTASVEDWMGTELVRFEGRNSSFEAIEWKEQEAEKYATNDNGRMIEVDSNEYDERYNGASEDLYVIGYDVQGEKTAVEFG